MPHISPPSRRALMIAVILATPFVWIFLRTHFMLHSRFAQTSLLRPMENVYQAAGNSTFGFRSILYLNTKSRYDRLDAASLQAYLSGVTITEYPAVEKDSIHEVGLPPSKNMKSLTIGQIGCWRAHANVWAEILREASAPVLILESDAAWDTNIRKMIPNLNYHFRELLAATHSTALYNPGRWSANHDQTKDLPEDDVWMSRHWDIFSFGHCMEHADKSKHSRTYEDRYLPPGETQVLSRKRVVQKSEGIVCTTAYAITQTGAAKLLLKTAANFDAPVDLIMMDLIKKGELTAYSMEPPLITQWRYVPNIGMEERGSNSDINPIEEHNDQDAALKQQAAEEAWEKVDRTGNVWQLWNGAESSFDELALQAAVIKLRGYESQ